MDSKLLNILACPLCKGALTYKKNQSELICKADKLGFKIEDDIPIMLINQARKLDMEEIDNM
ncbi:MAG: Trm112 family protein [Gammaproteobacteria bacterium]|nr:MAG: Trm112 family protein [Gammaproteobacteria bacterium]